MHNSSNGHTVGEYALLLGMLGLLAVGGLQLLGSSLANVLGASTQTSHQNELKDYYAKTLGIQLNLTNNGSVAGVNGARVNDSASTQSVNSINQLGSAVPISVNVSSVDGNNQTTLGTLRLAAYLDQLAQQETDPVKKSYLAKLAELAYYMGANEGELDDFDNYSLDTKYSNADAFNDLMAKQTQFQALLANPPAGVNQQDLAQVLPITGEVNQIASNYKSALQSLIGPDGKIDSEFMIKDPSKSTSRVFVSCSPLSCPNMELIPNFSQVPMHNTTYDAIVPYNQLKAQVQTTLSEYPLPTGTGDAPVLTTLQDATTTDNTATKQ